jgi:hypothetical protein
MIKAIAMNARMRQLRKRNPIGLCNPIPMKIFGIPRNNIGSIRI